MPPCCAEPGCLGASQPPVFPSFLRGVVSTSLQCPPIHQGADPSLVPCPTPVPSASAHLNQGAALVICSQRP